MIELPRTRQEYTQFALEHSGNNTLLHVRLLSGDIESARDYGRDYFEKQKVLDAWVLYTAEKFPELVTLDADPNDPSNIRVSVANVPAIRIIHASNLHRSILEYTDA